LEDEVKYDERLHTQLTSDLRIYRLLNGMWQVSGAHGRIDPRKAIQTMLAYHEAGFTTWDLADHYGPAEDLIGEFRRQLKAARGAAALADVQAFTKWVPQSMRMTPRVVEEAIDVSLRRMDSESLDLLQFHWWDYENEQYLSALENLVQLQQSGKIKHLALTNFDTLHLQRIIEHGIPIVSNQVQYSLIDRRPEVSMVNLCQERQVWLLTYGTLCGGFLSDAYLGQPEPGRWDMATASLKKYKQMIDAWGGWSLFQELLIALKSIADKHVVSIANVATRYILDKPKVAGVIVGVRLGVSDHREDNVRVSSLQLDGQDLQRIENILIRSNDLYRIIGDCGDEYR
jgi:aryl-alcohol dehydrogenase-like predicted oxidoreductase